MCTWRKTQNIPWPALDKMPNDSVLQKTLTIKNNNRQLVASNCLIYKFLSEYVKYYKGI